MGLNDEGGRARLCRVNGEQRARLTDLSTNVSLTRASWESISTRYVTLGLSRGVPVKLAPAPFYSLRIPFSSLVRVTPLLAMAVL
jgi:hypothetical protein